MKFLSENGSNKGVSDFSANIITHNGNNPGQVRQQA
jgi:hypothetical protein